MLSERQLFMSLGRTLIKQHLRVRTMEGTEAEVKGEGILL